MKLFCFLLILLVVFCPDFSGGAGLNADLISICHKITKYHFHSTTPREVKGKRSPDLDINPTLEDFAELCNHVKNASHSLELFEKYLMEDYGGINNVKAIVETILPVLIQRIMNITQQCRIDIFAFIGKLTNGPNDWPMKMLDASGKPLSGILKGATHWAGDFYQCTRINMPFQPGNITETNPLIRGQYCSMHVAIPEYLKKTLIPAHMNSAFASIVDSLEIKWDFCSTQRCSNQELKFIFGPIFDITNKTLGIELTDLTCKTPVHLLKKKTAIGTLVLIGVICIFLLIGTLYDLIFYDKSPEFDEDFISYDNDINMYSSTHYNNAYEMDSLSAGSHTNSFSLNNKNGDIAANGNNEVILIPSENSPSGKKPAPMAPDHSLSKPKAPTTPPLPPPPETETLPGASNSIAFLNSNQNANSFTISGPVPNTNTTTEHDIFNDKTSADRGFGTFLLAFSVRRNAYWLLNTKHTVEVLSCINGIRFLSMAWIILGHTYKLASEDYIKNMMDGLELHQSFTFQAVLAAPFAVDTFFLLSGTLLTYNFLDNYYSKGNIGLKTVFLIYVRRYLRLTPCYAVVLMIYTFILPNLFDGPYWSTDFSENCRSHWWQNLLYINNIFKLKQGCMPWTWFLANDMQFFIISPIILCQLILLPSFAFMTILMLFSAYIISSTILWQKISDPSIHSILDDDTYTKPWCRISPFLIGILLGYFLQQKNRKRSFPKFFQLCGWIFAAGICFFLSYIKYTMNRKENPATWLNSQYTAYEVVSHPLWAMAISWVIIICASGNGGIISDILSLRFWVFLSRLTYGAYILHPIVIMVGMRMNMAPLYLSVATTTYAFIGHLTLSYGLSFIVALLFEMPIRMMEKVISNRK